MDENNAQLGAEEEAPANLPKTEKTEMPSMEDLLEQTDMELEIPQSGEIREGTIMHVGEDEILVSIGAKSEGVIHTRELERLENKERSDLLVEGKSIPVYVIRPEDQNGNVLLSYVRAKEEKDWEWVEELLQTDETVEAHIGGYNKGGLIVPIGTLRGFVPASQVSALRRISKEGDSNEQRWAKMVGESVKVRVIEVDRGRRRLILSERAALKETREALKERLLDELGEGDVRAGRVTSLAEFGAFVNIDGADGLVHLSEISWERIDHPSEVLEVGQQVDVKVISIDRDRRRIGLSIRQLQEDPWVSKVNKLRVGQLVEGTVTHLTKFGAFAKINDDEELEGLIHISELSEDRIGHPKEIVKEGDRLTLRIIKVETDRRRIGLSLRKVDSAAYADLDWKMALAEEVDEIQEDQEPREDVTEEVVEELEELVVMEEEVLEEEIEQTEDDAVEEIHEVEEIEETVIVSEIETAEVEEVSEEIQAELEEDIEDEMVVAEIETDDEELLEAEEIEEEQEA